MHQRALLRMCASKTIGSQGFPTVPLHAPMISQPVQQNIFYCKRTPSIANLYNRTYSIVREHLLQVAGPAQHAPQTFHNLVLNIVSGNHCSPGDARAARPSMVLMMRHALLSMATKKKTRTVTYMRSPEPSASSFSLRFRPHRKCQGVIAL